MHSREDDRGTGHRHRKPGARHLVIAVAALTATACASDDDAAGTTSDGGTTETTATAAATEDTNATGATPMTSAPDEAAFPVTVEHKFGSTTVSEMPERIVTVGLTEQDALLAFGVVPVATTEWFGEEPGAIWPWAQDELSALQGETPEIVGDATKVNYEAVAAQRPDLILAIYSGLTQEDYDRLSAIAPTVAQPGDYVDYGVPWEDLTRTVGKVVGKADEAEAIIDDVNAGFAEAKEAHPEFDGASAVAATPYEGIFVYGPEDVRGRMLTSLGFELPPGLVEATGEEFGGDLSEERADLLDVDAIVWLDAEDGEGPLGGPLYETFDVHTQEREVHLDSEGDPLGGATSFVSVLSLPFLLDGLVPMLAAAVDGDPGTEVPA